MNHAKRRLIRDKLRKKLHSKYNIDTKSMSEIAIDFVNKYRIIDIWKELSKRSYKLAKKSWDKIDKQGK